MTVVKQVKLEEVSLILNVPFEDANRIRKGIRHALDPEDGWSEERGVQYLSKEYDMTVYKREEYLEIYINDAEITINMNKHIPENNVASVVENILTEPDTVACVGNFNVREHFTIEV